MPVSAPPAGPGPQPGAEGLSPLPCDSEERRVLVNAMAAMAALATPTAVSGAALAGAGLASGALLRFKSLMNGEGLACHLPRLCADRLYAYERIAAAHATANEPLRRLALELFQIYHRCEADGGAAMPPAPRGDIQ